VAPEGLRPRPPAGDLGSPHGDLDGFPYDAAIAVWEGIEANWISLITSWNLNGVKWKELSMAEMLWMVHLSTIERLKEDKPQQVRLYLNQTKDYTALREWDKSQLKDSSDK
jgi:hypothetical protein